MFHSLVAGGLNHLQAKMSTPDSKQVEVSVKKNIKPTDGEYSPVQPGGSLILAWQIRHKRVVMIGGGNVAAGRILNLLNADALITLICPTEGLHPEVSYRLQTHPERIVHLSRNFLSSDLDDPTISLALTAIDDPEESTKIYQLCHAKRIPVNVADVPEECDFYFGSTHRDGPLQIMVSTNGNGPRLASIIRKRIARSLPSNTGRAIEKVGELRRKLREIAPGKGGIEGQKRMEWMSRVCDEWSLDELGDMTEGDMQLLLKGFVGGSVKSYDEVIKMGKVLESVRIGEEEDDKNDI